MAFNTAALTTYVEQNVDELLVRSFIESKTISMITPYPGVKTSENMHLLDEDITFSDADCTCSASGATTFTPRTMTVGKILVNKEWCADDLERAATQRALPLGATYKNLPFEQQISDLLASLIAEKNEVAIWLADTNSGNPILNKFTGLIKNINNGIGAGVVQNTSTTGALTSSNVRTAFEGQWTNIPAALLNKDDLVTFCGKTEFRTLAAKIAADKEYNYTTDEAVKNWEMYYPGTTLKIVAVDGLNATNYLVTARLSNLFWGTDDIADLGEFRFAQLQDLTDQFRFKAKYKLGSQVARLTEVVFYKPS